MIRCAAARFLASLGSAFLVSTGALASLGPFEHGAGIKAMGAGGVSYVNAQETTALSANPAQATSLGHRYDLGLDVLLLHPDTRIEGNALGPDSRSASDGRRWYFIPQAGISVPLNERWTFGMTMLQAGLGPDYPESPYLRFGGARRASLTLGSGSVVSALAWRPTPRHSFGAGLIVGYQFLEVKGLQFLTSTDPQFRVSTHPDKVTNQGKDGAFSVGYTVGWTGEITPRVSAGIGYRSKSWTQKLDDYRGLLPDKGSLELPATYGVALAWRVRDPWTLAVEWQRYEYESERAFRNSLSELSQGHLLGSSSGPGFGWEDQNAFKLGVTWQARPDLVLRAGYVHADQIIQSSDTLFTKMAPAAMTTHFTSGATYNWRNWELTGALTYCPRQEVDGRNSIPAAFGGGEADVRNEFFSAGVSLGRRF